MYRNIRENFPGIVITMLMMVAYAKCLYGFVVGAV